VNVEDEPVSKDSKEGRETFDSMNQGHGNLGCGSRAEDMSTDLEKCKR